MRISTAQIFANGIDAIGQQQRALAHTQQQLATGRRMLSPSDDPAGAVQSLSGRAALSALDQLDRNADAASHRLLQQETVLAEMGEMLQRVRELTLQAANGSQTDDSRAALALELRELGEGLLGHANSRAANGEYLFAGTRSASRPFIRDPQGTVEYLGNREVREVAISADRTVAIGESGDAFMTVPRGNGAYTVTPTTANQGTARVTVSEVTDPQAPMDAAFALSFLDAAAYEIRDGGGTVVASGALGADGTLDFGGRRIGFAGEPAAGDTFEIAPAGTMSVFELVDDLAARLERPVASPADRALLDHQAGVALTELDGALERVLSLRSSAGARLNGIESQQQANADVRLQLETMLSEVEDLDIAEAISRLMTQQSALQAAQRTYVQVSRLSLFDFM